MAIIRKHCQKVVLGISGGVDSTVAGLILKKQGFDVHAVFMRNWDVADEMGKCSVDGDLQDASISCDKLGLTLNEVNFSKDYWNYVFTDLLDKYQNGQTPNPDILCNRYIKFNKFVNYSIHKFGADAIATGHYAQTSFGKFLEFSNSFTGVRLLKAVDDVKDQTFFLNQVHQKDLQKAMFPLGSLTKAQVKRIAIENNFHHVLRKKESAGICFIGRRNFQSFISEYLADNNGFFKDIDTGYIVGSHRGIHHWTIGQRCRIGGHPDRLYVAKKIPETKDILVALGKKHSILCGQYLTTRAPHWIHSVPELLRRGRILNCDFRFQHAEPLIPCQVMLKDTSSLVIILGKPLFALTPGQFAVLYKDNECLGGAVIDNTSPSLYTLCKKYK